MAYHILWKVINLTDKMYKSLSRNQSFFFEKKKIYQKLRSMNRVVNWLNIPATQIHQYTHARSHACMHAHYPSNVVGLSWARNGKSGWKIPADGIADEENVIIVFPSVSWAITTATITIEKKRTNTRTHARTDRKKTANIHSKGKYAHFLKMSVKNSHLGMIRG